MIQNMDGHFTLLYLYPKDYCDLGRIVEGISQRLTKLVQTQPHKLQGKLVFDKDFSTENYAWGNLHVHSPMHAALFELLNAGVMLRTTRPGKHGLFCKDSFHLSVRPNELTRVVDA